ncbi:MAG TPA: class II aldolase/adducin family protein [Chloroflexota bacterium]|nr:class II aldolase/adducin family protein [Chloroflexota bacterium]
MPQSRLAGLAEQVAETAAAIVASGAISANGHGNVSIRIPDASEMLFTTAPTLRGLTADMVARIRLDGQILDGEVPPINKAVIDMHTAIYADHPEAGCVIHTHSPYATAFAVARRRIDCWIEALAMFGLADGVPVADYGPRGSAQAIANIRAAISPGGSAVLLANHGVLAFHRTPAQAVQVGSIVEEAAQDAINAMAIGGPTPIEPAMRAAALQRAVAFGVPMAPSGR